MKKLLELYFTFFKIGLFTFGGGYAMLPMLEKEVVENKKYATEDELMDYYAIGQCTPGVIAVNCATFIGNKTAGFWGGVFATLGVITPSIIIILIVAKVLNTFMDNPYVSHALAGIRIAVCALILNTVIKMARKSFKDMSCIYIFCFAFFIDLFIPVPTVVIVLLGALAGIIIQSYIEKKRTLIVKSQNDNSDSSDEYDSDDESSSSSTTGGAK